MMPQQPPPQDPSTPAQPAGAGGQQPKQPQLPINPQWQRQFDIATLMFQNIQRHMQQSWQDKQTPATQARARESDQNIGGSDGQNNNTQDMQQVQGKQAPY